MLPFYGHSRNGIPPIPFPSWSFHLLFLTQIFHLCADRIEWDEDIRRGVNTAISGWRLMWHQIKAEAGLDLVVLGGWSVFRQINAKGDLDLEVSSED